MNKDLILKILCCSNYDIPKNCEYYLLTKDIYVIGYHVNTINAARYLPVFDNQICKQLKKVHREMYFKLVKKTLLECRFPHLVVNCIIKNLKLL